jgi:hypothetical protein
MASAGLPGGESAHAGGAGSWFGNPADLSPEDLLRIETGLMGMFSGLSPYVVLGCAIAALRL